MYRLIQSERFDIISNQSTGTKMPRADWKLVSQTEFSIPISMVEQAKIGSYFQNLDTLITLHQRECIHHMINQVTKDSLFIDYYSQWRSVYKEGIKCQLKMYKIS